MGIIAKTKLEPITLLSDDLETLTGTTLHVRTRVLSRR